MGAQIAYGWGNFSCHTKPITPQFPSWCPDAAWQHMQVQDTRNLGNSEPLNAYKCHIMRASKQGGRSAQPSKIHVLG